MELSGTLRSELSVLRQFLVRSNPNEKTQISISIYIQIYAENYYYVTNITNQASQSSQICYI